MNHMGIRTDRLETCWQTDYSDSLGSSSSQIPASSCPTRARRTPIGRFMRST